MLYVTRREDKILNVSDLVNILLLTNIKSYLRYSEVFRQILITKIL